MRNLLVCVSVGLLASTSVAQIPMSKYVRTFTGNVTRGYFFQAPVDFTVTELQVPDELNKGSYCVALYKLTAAPPPYSGTVPAKPTFYAFVKDVHSCAKVPAAAGAFKKGEFCCVLGGGGTEFGALSNSYGANGGANNPSAILGTPIAVGLQRCGMQINIGPTKGDGLMWSEVNGPIARVKMTVATGAGSCDFCPPSNGSAELQVCATNPTIIGKEMKLEMKSGATSNTGALIAFGLLRVNVVLPGFGRLCVNGIKGIVGFGLGPIPNAATGAIVSLGTIPAATPSGVKIVFQGALLTSSRVPSLTNGLEIVTGK